MVADLYRAIIAEFCKFLDWLIVVLQLTANNQTEKTTWQSSKLQETERDAANLYAKQVAHWIGKYDEILDFGATVNSTN